MKVTRSHPWVVRQTARRASAHFWRSVPLASAGGKDMRSENEVSIMSDSNPVDPKNGEHTNLIRWGGLAAVLAGILRGIASLTPTYTSVWLQFFYLAIDVLL